MGKLTHQEILEQAIQKAIEGGWVDGDAAINQLKTIPNWSLSGQTAFVMSVIFNHDFAKALWGNGNGYTGGKGYFPIIPRWKSELEQIVIAEDPIQYLADSLGLDTKAKA